MRRRNSALIVWLAASAALAQQQQQEEKPANVEGIVTHALTGAPILRAHIRCEGFAAGKQQQYGAMTNAEGKYSITGLPAGTYTVTADRIGFVMPVENGRRGMSLSLRPDGKGEAKLKLTPTGAILGRVVDPDGNPVEGAGVHAEGSDGNHGISAMTDHKGEYRIGGLTPGRYRVRAAPTMLPVSPETRTDGSEEVRYVTTYHPSGIDRKAGTRLDVRSGADLTGVDVKLAQWPMVRVSGIVTGMPVGGPPNSVSVQTRTAGAVGQTAIVGPDGKFEVWNLDPGKWLLSAAAFRGEQTQSAALEVEVGAQHVEGLELRMMAAFEVTGQAVFEGDSTKPGGGTPNAPPPRMSLLEVNRLGGARGTQPIVLPADGAFRFVNVTLGRYRINYSWRAGIKSVRLGAVEMENQTLDLSNGTGGATVTVVFTPATAQVSGTVRDDKGPVAGAMVVLRNPTVSVGSTNAAYRAVTHADGTYLFGNVPAGRYVLLSADEGETNPISDTYEDYEDVLVELDIGAGEKIHSDLRRHSVPR